MAYVLRDLSEKVSRTPIPACSVCADMCSPNSNFSCRNGSGKGFISLINLKTEVGSMFTTEEGLGIALIEFYIYDPLKSVIRPVQSWVVREKMMCLIRDL